MSLELPSSLSPSKVSSFTDCALAFRFSAIDRLPDPPTVATVKGTLVHAALERLMLRPPADRTPDAATEDLSDAVEALRTDREFLDLDLTADEAARMAADAASLVERYFALEDPTSITPIGLELKLDVEIDGLRLRGIIDRLEVADDGELVVTDYKTGRAPGPNFEQSRLNGVHFYAFLCERVLGRRPARVQLLHLADPVAIVTVPTEQSIRALERKVKAIWAAIERACERDDFRPRTSRALRLLRLPELLPGLRGRPRGGASRRRRPPRRGGPGRDRRHRRDRHRRARSIGPVSPDEGPPTTARRPTTMSRSRCLRRIWSTRPWRASSPGIRGCPCPITSSNPRAGSHPSTASTSRSTVPSIACGAAAGRPHPLLTHRAR